MRAAATTFAALTAVAVLLLTVNGAGADAEDPAAQPASETGPRHQLLGNWKIGRSGKLAMGRSRGRVAGRVSRTARLAGCRVPADVDLLRALRFIRREPQSDIWVGKLALPDRERDCRRRLVGVRLRVSSDLRLRAVYRDLGTRRTARLRRVRPRATAEDPIVATWERNEAGIDVELRRGAFVGVARRAYLVGNNCVVEAGTVVWRLRPSAPGRYDGVAQTFLPPPTCDPGVPSDSLWRLESEHRLLRQAPDGTLTEYTRASG